MRSTNSGSVELTQSEKPAACGPNDRYRRRKPDTDQDAHRIFYFPGPLYGISIDIARATFYRPIGGTSSIKRAGRNCHCGNWPCGSTTPKATSCKRLRSVACEFSSYALAQKALQIRLRSQKSFHFFRASPKNVTNSLRAQRV